MRQHEEEDASIRRDQESAMGTGGTALRNIEELNRRADSAAGGADVAEWENLRADYSWALEEARRVLEVSESLRAFECWISNNTMTEFSFGPKSRLPCTGLGRWS